MAPENSLEQSQSQSTGGGRKVDETLVTQGTVLWLPAKEDLPKHAVRRAHGKGAVEEGIFNHPIVVVSRPKDQSDIIHFHLVTSNKGKRLNELYSKDSEFHASRRSWFLPVGPDLKHPDARSKKTKKRFPTLELSDGATLNFESYVNIRHVYKIDLSLLQTYANPDTPDVTAYQFEKESCIRMLAKTKSLTFYEPVLQIDNPQRAQLEQDYISGSRMIADWNPYIADGTPNVDFRFNTANEDETSCLPIKVPPDLDDGRIIIG